jgi:hypothetical protein
MCAVTNSMPPRVSIFFSNALRIGNPAISSP